MKIKDEELKKIKEQQADLHKLVNEIGVLETQKHGLLHDVAILNQDITEFKNQLEKDYGQIEVNLEDGSYKKLEKEEVVGDHV